MYFRPIDTDTGHRPILKRSCSLCDCHQIVREKRNNLFRMHLNQELAMSESSQQHQPHDIPLNQLTSADIGSSASGPADGAGHEAFVSDEPFRGLPGGGSGGPDEAMLLEALQKPQNGQIGQNGQNSQNGQNGQNGQNEATAAGAEGCESNHFVVENSSNAGTISTMSSEPFSEQVIQYDTRL